MRPDGARRGEHLARGRVVARVLRQVHVAQGAVWSDHEDAAELGGMPDDPALVHRHAALADA